MAHPKNDASRRDKSAGAALPQKNAVPSVNGETAHEESLLDEALEETFPASDPVELQAEPKRASHKEAGQTQEDAAEHEERLLDEALEETFPASDPIAVPDSATVARTVSRQRH
jgi:hypothetical protein